MAHALDALRDWLTKTADPEKGLDQAEKAVQPLLLHPEDAAALRTLFARARAENAAVVRLVGFLADLVHRYAYPYQTDLVERVLDIRDGLAPSRGPPVIGENGAFRRGDLIVRAIGDVIQDAVFLEAEPVSAHSRTFGRMGAMQVLGQTDELNFVDRWFLDDVHHGKDFGRPL